MVQQRANKWHFGGSKKKLTCSWVPVMVIILSLLPGWTSLAMMICAPDCARMARILCPWVPIMDPARSLGMETWEKARIKRQEGAMEGRKGRKEREHVKNKQNQNRGKRKEKKIMCLLDGHLRNNYHGAFYGVFHYLLRGPFAFAPWGVGLSSKCGIEMRIPIEHDYTKNSCNFQLQIYLLIFLKFVIFSK